MEEDIDKWNNWKILFGEMNANEKYDFDQKISEDQCLLLKMRMEK